MWEEDRETADCGVRGREVLKLENRCSVSRLRSELSLLLGAICICWCSSQVDFLQVSLKNPHNATLIG